jgi:hypothetical protein
VTTDHRFPRRLLHTRHPHVAIRRPRRNRPHLPRRRPTVAVLQQEPRGVATSTERDNHGVKLQRRRGRTKSRLVMSRTSSGVGRITGTVQGVMHD